MDSLELIGLSEDELQEQFYQSCVKGDMELFLTLIKTPSLLSKIKINAEHQKAFRLACIHQKTDITDYLINNQLVTANKLTLQYSSVYPPVAEKMNKLLLLQELQINLKVVQKRQKNIKI